MFCRNQQSTKVVVCILTDTVVGLDSHSLTAASPKTFFLRSTTLAEHFHYDVDLDEYEQHQRALNVALKNHGLVGPS